MSDLREELARAMCHATRLSRACTQKGDPCEAGCKAKIENHVLLDYADAILPVIARVRAEEREACAKVAEDVRGVVYGVFGAPFRKNRSAAMRRWLLFVPSEIAAAIRGRP